MTGQIIKLKKCNSTIRRCLAVAGLLAVSVAPPALAAPQAKLPVIQNVGVVPVQWESSASGLAGARDALDKAFPDAVRRARKFRVLSDDLVVGLWKDADGREELRGEFELQAFVNLTVAPRGDVVAWTARVMDGWLKSVLVESDTVAKHWLQTASDDQIKDKVEQLVYRLFNRLPVDVSVTSVQNSYITLSGGSEQGIESGDKVDLIRTSIASLHPANGTWLEFKKVPLGTAHIIEVKNFTSVAKLTDQVRDGAVEVGDGARIGAISSRLKFARLAENEGLKDSGNQNTIIVPPLYQGEAPAANSPAAAKPKAPEPKAKGGLFDEEPAPVAQNAPAAENPAPQADDEQQAQEPPADDGGPTVWDTFRDEAGSHRAFDDVQLYTGPYWWSVKGRVNDSGRIPMWLLNTIGGGVTRTMFYKIKGAFGGGLLFGNTSNGSYLGYDTYARMYWESDLYLADGLLKYWRAGGAASFSGMSVAKGAYGGGDWIRAGFFGGIGGSIMIGEGQRYDWFTDFTLMPMNIGRVGYDGSRKVVESSFGTKLAIGAFKFEPPQVIQWGGAIELGDERQTLQNGHRPHFEDYWLKLMAKYAL